MRNGEILLNEPDEVSAHIVNHFTNLSTQTTNVVNNGMVEEVIPNLIIDKINERLTVLPNEEEIHDVVFFH
jgi:hypothetical protein